MSSSVRKYWVLASKGFRQNLQYSASHLINTVASAVFGVIYIHLWRSVTPASGFADYTSSAITQYIAFNQVTMWFTQFGIRIQARIRDAVRSGDIATELLRPVSFFAYRVSFEYGSMVYGLLFRGLPVAAMLAGFGFYLPKNPATWAWTAISLALGAYIAIVQLYLVGIASFWTTEIRTASWVVTTLSLTLGGGSMPLEVLPRPAYLVAKWSPFACLTYNPARIYLELSGPVLILPALAWSCALSLAAHWATSAARARLEVQGG